MIVYKQICVGMFLDSKFTIKKVMQKARKKRETFLLA